MKQKLKVDDTKKNGKNNYMKMVEVKRLLVIPN